MSLREQEEGRQKLAFSTHINGPNTLEDLLQTPVYSRLLWKVREQIKSRDFDQPGTLNNRTICFKVTEKGPH